jgi:hypothetical protein
MILRELGGFDRFRNCQLPGVSGHCVAPWTVHAETEVRGQVLQLTGSAGSFPATNAGNNLSQKVFRIRSGQSQNFAREWTSLRHAFLASLASTDASHWQMLFCQFTRWTAMWGCDQQPSAASAQPIRKCEVLSIPLRSLFGSEHHGGGWQSGRIGAQLFVGSVAHLKFELGAVGDVFMADPDLLMRVTIEPDALDVFVVR